jgi:hypothetical protein
MIPPYRTAVASVSGPTFFYLVVIGIAALIAIPCLAFIPGGASRKVLWTTYALFASAMVFLLFVVL